MNHVGPRAGVQVPAPRPQFHFFRQVRVAEENESEAAIEQVVCGVSVLCRGLVIVVEIPVGLQRLEGFEQRRQATPEVRAVFAEK